MTDGLRSMICLALGVWSGVGIAACAALGHYMALR